MRVNAPWRLAAALKRRDAKAQKVAAELLARRPAGALDSIR